MKNRGLTSLFMLIVLALIVGGCGNSNEGSGNEKTGGSTDTVKKEVAIEFWAGPTYKDVEGVDSPEFGDYEKAMIDEFQKQNPHIKVNFQLVGWTDIEQKLTVALTGNNQPDIVLEALDRRLSKYAATGKVEDISDFYDPSQFQDSMMDAVVIGGKTYGIPISMNPEYVFLNKTIFKNKGLEHLIPADRDWTFDEMRAALKEVSGEGIYGTAFYASNEQGDEMQLMSYFGMGGEMFNEDQSEAIMDQYKEAEEYIQMMLDMIQEGTAAPGPASTDVLGALEMFKQGKIAMLPFAQSLYSTIAAGMADGSVDKNLELYAIKPLHKEGITPKTAIAGVHGYTVFQQTDPDKREAVKKFIQYMTSMENIRAMAKSGGYVSSHKDAGYEVDNEDMNIIMKEVATLPSANLGKKSPVYAGVRVLWFPELQAAFTNKKTPKQAVADFTQKANDLINQQGK